APPTTTLAVVLLAFATFGRAGRLLDRAVRPLALMPLALPLALVAVVDVDAPLLGGGPQELLAFFSLVPSVVPLAVAGAWVGRLAARWVVRRPAEVAVQALAWAATLGAAGLVGVAAARAQRPSPEGYVD